MFYRQDWITNQINLMIKFIVRIAFDKDGGDYNFLEQEIGMETILKSKLNKLLAQNDFCKGEDLLFEQINPSKKEHLALAVWFYQKLGEKTEEELKAGNFSKEEIKDGLKEIIKLSNIETGKIKGLEISLNERNEK